MQCRRLIPLRLLLRDTHSMCGQGHLLQAEFTVHYTPFPPTCSEQVFGGDNKIFLILARFDTVRRSPHVADFVGIETVH